MSRSEMLAKMQGKVTSTSTAFHIRNGLSAISSKSAEPTEDWTKDEIRGWLEDHDIEFLLADTKAELLDRV